MVGSTPALHDAICFVYLAMDSVMLHSAAGASSSPAVAFVLLGLVLPSFHSACNLLSAFPSTTLDYFIHFFQRVE
jgi:hypothetical protein